MKRIGRIILALAFVFFRGLSLYGSDVHVSASLEEDVIYENQRTYVDIKVEGAKKVAIVGKPTVKGLSFREAGRSSWTNIVNFKMTSGIAVKVEVQASGPGDFKIAPFTVAADGVPVKTNSLVLHVKKGEAPRSSSRTLLDDFFGTEKQREYSFKTTQELSTDANYKGEMVVSRIYLLAEPGVRCEYTKTQDPIIKNAMTTEIEEEIPEETVTRDGITYIKKHIDTYGIKTMTTGTHMIDGAAVYIRYNQPEGPFVHTRSKNMIFNTLFLDTKELPSEGKPDDFSGTVGSYRAYTLDLDKKVNLDKGEERAFTLTLSGRGDLASLKPPEITAADGLKVYYSSRDDNFSFDKNAYNGSVIFHYSIIAESEGEYTLRVPPFTYFDPAQGSYGTLRCGAVPVRVNAGSNSFGSRESDDEPEDESDHSLLKSVFVIIGFIILGGGVIILLIRITGGEERKALAKRKEKDERSRAPRKNRSEKYIASKPVQIKAEDEIPISTIELKKLYKARLQKVQQGGSGDELFKELITVIRFLINHDELKKPDGLQEELVSVHDYLVSSRYGGGLPKMELLYSISQKIIQLLS